MTDEFLLDTPQLRSFIAEVRAIQARESSPAAAIAAIRPHFAALMADQTWLPDSFRQPAPESGMGGGIASWLIYRAGDGSLSLFALVVPPGSSTPVHDHLAWGLVGLYVGEQREEVFEPEPTARESPDRRPLRLTAINELREGDFYELIPPDGDIHRVTTTSAAPSISLHLLGNDTGCVQRHRFDPDSGAVAPFTSGYTNRACDS
jgi:3-mercaptopropionate dioxygenase